MVRREYGRIGSNDTKCPCTIIQTLIYYIKMNRCRLKRVVFAVVS